MSGHISSVDARLHGHRMNGYCKPASGMKSNLDLCQEKVRTMFCHMQLAPSRRSSLSHFRSENWRCDPASATSEVKIHQGATVALAQHDFSLGADTSA